MVTVVETRTGLGVFEVNVVVPTNYTILVYVIVMWFFGHTHGALVDQLLIILYIVARVEERERELGKTQGRQ